MRSKKEPRGRNSFIEAARRAGIIEAVIEVIAEFGYGQAAAGQRRAFIGIDLAAYGGELITLFEHGLRR